MAAADDGTPAPDVLNRLADSTPQLTEAVRQAVAVLARQVRMLRSAVIGVVALLVALAYLQYQVMWTQAQVSKTRERVLCPLYTVLIARVESLPGPLDERQAQAVKAITDGYAVLGCEHVPLRPPPVGAH
jgi:hypothetical protein